MSDPFYGVKVYDQDGDIVTIEPRMLAGRDIGERERSAIESAIQQLSGFIGAVEAPIQLPPLKGKELHKGTGDVLKDLDHAEHLTNTDEPGFGEIVCSGRQLAFVNRAIRVARGVIKQQRERHGSR